MACLRMLSLSGAAGGAQQQVVPQVAQAAQAANAPSPAQSAAVAQTIQKSSVSARIVSEAPFVQPRTVPLSTVQAGATSSGTVQPSVPAAPSSQLLQTSGTEATVQAVQTARGVSNVASSLNQQAAESDADSEPSYLDLEPEYFSGNDLDYGSEPIFDQADDAQFTHLSPSSPVSDTIVLPEPWAGFSAKLPLSGMAAQLARQSEWVAVSGRAITLRVASKALAVGAHADRLRAVLTEYFGFVVQVYFEIGAGQGQSAHAVDQAAQAARQRAAEHSVTVDPFVQALMRDFGAQVVPGSIRPGHAAL
jgi:DNA polymerase-3 subunit gamma/tau